MVQIDSDSSDDESYDLGFMLQEIKEEWKYVGYHKLKLSLLENMDQSLELVRALKSGQVPPYYYDLYLTEFQEKIEGGTKMAERLQRHYDKIPKVFVLKDDERIDIFVRIAKGVTGRAIKQAASRRMDCNFDSLDLRFMSGRLLEDDEEVKGTSHAVLTYALKRCEICGEIHAECPKCKSKGDVVHERKYGLILCPDCLEDAYQAKHEMEIEEMACLSEDGS